MLEVGPGKALTSLARQQPGAKAATIASLRHPEESGPDDEVLAAATAHLWRLGANIDWRATHAAERRYRVALPTYPFERQRFWIETAPSDTVPVTGTSMRPPKRADVGSWFHVPSWARSAAPPRRAHAALSHPRTCLVFHDGEPVAPLLVQSLQRSGFRVTSVQPGAQFTRAASDRYLLRPGVAEDYDALFAQLHEDRTAVDAIVHLWGVGEPSDADGRSKTDRILHRTYDSLIGIAQAVGHRLSEGGCRLVVVTTGMHDVMAGDIVSADKAVTAGPCGVIPLEYPQLACVSVDIDEPTSGAPAAPWLADALASELDCKADEGIVAYRQGRRWVRRFEPVPLDAPTPDEVPLRDGGVYLLTGGFGAMALALADLLASSVRARLVLVGRSAILPRAAWQTHLATHDQTDRTSDLIRRIQALEAKGAEVMVTHADVSDSAAMREVIHDVRERYGRIDGVIHAAGVAGGGLIGDKDGGAATREALGAKTFGTHALFAALEAERPDWIVLCSSLNAVFPSAGATDYCAANAFLDAYAEAHDHPAGTRVISIGWDTWQQAGMAVNLRVPRHLEDAKRENLLHGMTNTEGQDVLRRILASPAPHVLVLTQGYDALRRVSRVLAAEQVAESASNGQPTVIEQRVTAKTSHARPSVSSEYVAPEGDIEPQIAQMWESLLGIDRVGRHDNFFELGGHSLLATQLISRIRDRFGMQLPLRTIFEANTVAELAGHVTSMKWALGAPVLAGEAAREEIDL